MKKTTKLAVHVLIAERTEALEQRLKKFQKGLKGQQKRSQMKDLLPGEMERSLKHEEKIKAEILQTETELAHSPKYNTNVLRAELWGAAQKEQVALEKAYPTHRLYSMCAHDLAIFRALVHIITMNKGKDPEKIRGYFYLPVTQGAVYRINSNTKAGHIPEEITQEVREADNICVEFQATLPRPAAEPAATAAT